MYPSSKLKLAEIGRRAADVLEAGAMGRKSMTAVEVETASKSIEAEMIAVAAADASVEDPRYEDGPALVHARGKLSLIHDRAEVLKAMIAEDGDPMGVRSGKLADLEAEDRSLTSVIRQLEAE